MTTLAQTCPELQAPCIESTDRDVNRVQKKLGYTRAGRTFRAIDRLGNSLRLIDSTDSMVREFESELAMTSASRFKLESDVAEVGQKLRQANDARDPVHRRSIYRSLGDRPIQVLIACTSTEYWEAVNWLRRPLRTFWEHRGNWVTAAAFARLHYVKAAQIASNSYEIPWIKAVDTAWFAAISDQRELARESVLDALSEFKSRRESMGEAHCHRVLGLLALHDMSVSNDNRSQLALREFRRGDELASSNQKLGLSGRFRAHKAAALILVGDYDSAAKELDSAVSVARGQSDSHLLAVCLIKRAEIALAQERTSTAKLFLHDAIYASADIAAYEFGKACFLMAQCLERDSGEASNRLEDRLSLLHHATNYCRWSREAFQSIQQQHWIDISAEAEDRLFKKLPRPEDVPPEIEELLERKSFWLWDIGDQGTENK